MESNTLIRGGYNKEIKIKKPFDRAFEQLSGIDRPIVKAILMAKCKWSDSHFILKKNGERGITNQEEEIIIATFKTCGITWEPIAIQPEPSTI